ncbi:hypothetical protein FF38_11594 [Lucilia cuprina]|uniref:RNA 3'-terminal phosphate cyclase domain-containing protein n=1 Tax=Lucilia cuprina TaxID=7375 RepID=A0A0L0CBR1_LUCCU|nr:hypothetical protein FF38_11594 [Lucilia cuprina]
MLTLEFEENIPWRLVLATLSGQPVKITHIRPDDGGLKDYEVTFLRILDTITNGSVLEISQTGTSIVYKPGLVIGGAHQFNCPLSRGVGYFIEPLLVLAPFIYGCSLKIGAWKKSFMNKVEIKGHMTTVLDGNLS